MTADLRTTYLGLELTSPIVASAGPLTGDAASARALAAAGAAALVMPSLFEEEILQDEIHLNDALDLATGSGAEAADFFPNVPAIATAADRYARRLGEIKAAVDVPVIASLNASTAGGWVRTAAFLADSGADAIELNLYQVAADSERSAAEVEDDLLNVVRAVRAAIAVPLAVKLSPYYSSFANFARRVVRAGADGLVLFNRFYQPDIDLDGMEVVPRIALSSPWELRLPLRWTAILRPLEPNVSLAASTGVASGVDAAKAIAVGADVAMLTSALLRHGTASVAGVLEELATWLHDHEYESVAQLRGCLSHAHCADPAAFERANYLKMLHSWTSAGR
jgi:dihydroorotate dehydrogenase (fumarate)